MRVAIVGAGVISGQYLDSLARLDDVRLVAVADLDDERARTAAEQYGRGARALTVDELMRADDVDTIINLTIPAAHLDVCTAALESGKHVYVEKPLALTVADGRQLLDLASSRRLRIAGAPDTVLGTGLQTARAVIDGGHIGVPVAASASWSSPGHERWHPAPDFYYKTGGGPLFDMGPYYLTALATLLGPVRSVTATTGRSDRRRSIASGPRAGEPIAVEVDTHVTAVLEHEGGAVSTLLLSFEQWGSRQPRIEVHGTAGSVTVPDPNIFDGGVELLGTGREWRDVPALAGYAEAGRGYGVADLARAVAQNEAHRSSAEMALHVLDIMESIGLAAARRSAVSLSTTAQRPAPVPLTQLPAPRTEVVYGRL
ncbi:Gfo/Idh/MocA family protein [Pseudoclavibacter sp. RFBA6]|uniref:Gfo/Idh/MocA family protein n=1 Tax=Pseudoclavibacter sp. RFBA6 TaxID=2080573 RepID=UPI000CE82029|nr:Gfo/Idh/MocA family oxidoreductase [Pseudoclavibacter sp. RFBA6]PPG42349.1 oxidoreductase [Pseudoclavibacter sp. RFBA6]